MTKGLKMSAEDKIRETVTSNDVVLFMKGTATMPQCGFSSQIAGILNYMGVEYKDVNVLADDAVRQSIKEYSDWPTIPQLYVKGEFIGGCDIIRDMTLSGEFDGMLAESNINYDKVAAEEIRKANSS
jgi:monothiol glutaredoxin